MSIEYQPSKPFDDFRNISVGQARVIYEGDSYWGMPGWKLPGQRTTVDRDEAYAVAEKMNVLMGGVQVMREVGFTQSKEEVDKAVNFITRNGI